MEIDRYKRLIKYDGNDHIVTIPLEVDCISYEAFKCNDTIEQVIMPFKVISIEQSAFEDCTNLNEVSLSENMSIINKFAFKGCTNLEHINLSKSTHIDQGAFDGCLKLADSNGFIIFNDILYNYMGNEKKIIIPNNIKKIEQFAFSETDVEEVIIPNPVIIGESAFEKCSFLQNIILPENLTVIRKNLFKGCSSLANIIIPSFVRVIKEGAFSGCTTLQNIILPERLVRLSGSWISQGVFENCTSLKSIVIPKSVTDIGNAIFSGCSNLEDVILPENLMVIPEEMFKGCSSLKTIIIPNSVTKIGDKAFSGCSSLKTIDIPFPITKIPRSAFKGCTKLHTVILPESLNEIEDLGFYGCQNLEHIIFPKGIKFSGGKIFYECTKLRDENGCIVIDNTLLSYSNNSDPTILHRYLQQTTQLSPLPTIGLITTWSERISIMDFCSLFLFQTDKTIVKEAQCRISEKSESIDSMIDLLREKGKKHHFKKAIIFLLENLSMASKSQIMNLYEITLAAKYKDLPGLLEIYVAESQTISPDGHKIHPIENYCFQNFSSLVLDKYLKSAVLEDSTLSKVKYRDSDYFASPFVVKCALYPYMKQAPIKSEYYYQYLCEYDLKADKVAEALDVESLQLTLENIYNIFSNDNEYGVTKHREFLIPYCRFASGRQIKSIGARFSEWHSYTTYRVNGRYATMIAGAALLLNESREALFLADKLGFLDVAAKLRNTTEDVLRDTVLSVFGFNPEGVISYDLGSTIIDVSINADMTLSLLNKTTGKVVRSIPRKGIAEETFKASSEHFKELKKNVKNVVKNRIHNLKLDFLSGKSRLSADWKKSYLFNPILNKIGKITVWQYENKENDEKYGFMLDSDSQFINADNRIIEISDAGSISVAHPLDMTETEVHQWRKVLSETQIVQPFTQMFETAYRGTPVSYKKRYSGIVVPYFLLKNLEKEGYNVGGERFYNYWLDLTDGYLTIDFDPCGVYVVDNLHIQESITLCGLDLFSIDRKVNHALYRLDGICLEAIVQANDISAMELFSDQLHEKNILLLVDIANEYKSNDCLVWLMDFKNKHFPDAIEDLSL